LEFLDCVFVTTSYPTLPHSNTMSSITEKDDAGHNSGHETLHDVEQAIPKGLLREEGAHHPKVANPAPLGLLAFATSIFMISLINVKPRGIETSNIVIANMMFFGGAAQFLAGIMDFIHCNTVRHPHTSRLI
jgi:hypothetical protein